MKKLLSLGVSVFAAGAAFAAANVDPAQLQARTSLNVIGPELLTSHLRHNGLQNAMVSSPSLFYALSVLALGADGASQELLASRLLTDPDASLADVAPPLAALLSTDNSGDNGDSRNGAFRLSHSLWSTNGASDRKPFVLAEGFLATAEALYGAGHRPLDFRATGAARLINDWAEEQTRGLIPAVIDDALLSRLDWVILNTTLFEGTWGTAMQRVGAQDAYRFITLDGHSQAAATIRTVDYAARVIDLDDGSLVFQLPFAGGHYAFIVHMPAPEQADVRGWLLHVAVPGFAGMAERVIGGEGSLHPLSIQLPAFAFSDTVTMGGLSPLTRDLGLAPLFERGVDLSRLSEQPSRVGIIKQDTRIELDEKGVRAAAATLVGGVKSTSVRPSHRRRQIVVNRPFAFAIVERASRTLLFNGVLVSPPHTQAH
ncbi:serpin family protein [Cyanobium gracile]|uniref:Serpin family protein n=1 Tax=Cyanobium gracile UHCC 0281 TaxID=3110309 RepID=A0ABU5STH3_9CYAN|nr:serpin family protein [Cyanobium gracile]MEA5441765.1 serpin family protein [Cyanobium gracile UHCC 0281]